MGLNVLGTLGGIGSGVVSGLQDVNALKAQDIQNQQAQIQLDENQKLQQDFNREQGNQAAYRETAAGFKPTTSSVYVQPGASQQAGLDSAKVAGDQDWNNAVDASTQDAGQIQSTKPVDPGQVYSALEQQAMQRGDPTQMQAFMKMKIAHDQLVNEGAVQSARLLYSGGTPEQIESAFNAQGNMKVMPGSTQIMTDPTTGARSVSAIDASTGHPITMNSDQAKSILQMNGAMKLPEYKAAGNSGVIFNNLTGDTKGEYHNGITVLGNGASAVQSDGEGGVKVIANNPKTFNPNGGAGGGVKYHFTPQADGTTLVQSSVPGANPYILTDPRTGQPSMGAFARNQAIQLAKIGSTVVDPGLANTNTKAVTQAVDNAVQAQANPTPPNPRLPAATSYLKGAKSQDEMNARVVQLKKAGWTADQIREMSRQ